MQWLAKWLWQQMYKCAVTHLLYSGRALSMHCAYTPLQSCLTFNQASATDHLKQLCKHTCGQWDETGRAGQGRAGQGRAGQGRAGQGRAGQGRVRGQGQHNGVIQLHVQLEIVRLEITGLSCKTTCILVQRTTTHL